MCGGNGHRVWDGGNGTDMARDIGNLIGWETWEWEWEICHLADYLLRKSWRKCEITGFVLCEIGNLCGKHTGYLRCHVLG